MSSLFCLSLFLILYKFKLYIIVLYTYNNTIRFIHFVFIQFSTQVSFSFLFYTLCFNCICIMNYTFYMFAMKRNYTMKILLCPVSFAFLSFSFYTIFKLYLISLFLVLYNSIQVYIPCQVSFKSFYTLTIIQFVLHNSFYTLRLYNSLPKCLSLSHFIHFVFIQFSAQVFFSFLFYTLCFNCICIANYTVSMFAMERNYAKFAIAYKYEFFICYM